MVRTGTDPLATLPAVRGAVLEAGNDQPVYGVRTMDQIVSESIADRRFSMLLLGIFAGLALLLAAVGIYGVISYTVAQRTREIGIRMVLGAGQADVLKVVVAQGMLPVLAGLAIGLAASFGLTRLMAGMLYGVNAGDPVTSYRRGAGASRRGARRHPGPRPPRHPGHSRGGLAVRIGGCIFAIPWKRTNRSNARGMSI